MSSSSPQQTPCRPPAGRSDAQPSQGESRCLPGNLSHLCSSPQVHQELSLCRHSMIYLLLHLSPTMISTMTDTKKSIAVHPPHSQRKPPQQARIATGQKSPSNRQQHLRHRVSLRLGGRRHLGPCGPCRALLPPAPAQHARRRLQGDFLRLTSQQNGQKQELPTVWVLWAPRPIMRASNVRSLSLSLQN